MPPTDPRMLPTLRDGRLRALAESGDKAAQAEMVKRGLAGDPRMEAERHKRKREFRVRMDWG